MNKKFEDFKLDKYIIKALYNLNYTIPSKVQEEVIPRLLKKEDVIVKSKTGSGKTASFGIPICENIDIENNNVQALIVVPTRELALQVKDEISNIGRLKKIRCSAIFGKQPIKEQIRELKQRVHIVVATPGRIIDHIGRNTINLDDIKYFIIDEADKMLNKGFIEDMEFILNKIPKNSAKGLFSATIYDDIQYICDKYLKVSNILDIKYNELFDKKQIIENKIKSSENDKYKNLKSIIYMENPTSLIIFCNTKDKVKKLYENMKKDGIPFPHMYLACGLDDPLLPPNRKFRDTMKELGVDVTYEEGPGAHEWDFWNRYIKKVLDWLPLDKDSKEGLNSGNVGL